MRRWSGLAVAGVLIGAGSAVYLLHSGGSPGLSLLKSAETATAQTDYEGTLETQTAIPGGWRTTELAGYFRRPGLSRMVYKTPPLNGVVQVHSRSYTWRYDPSTGQVTIEHAPPSEFAPPDPLMQNNYRVVVTGHGRVAGREVIQVDAVPRFTGNPRRRFWVDSATHVLMGWARLSPTGQPQSISRFTAISFKSEPASLFAPPPRSLKVASPVRLSHPMRAVQLERAVGFPLAVPTWIPRGYHEAGWFLSQCPDGCGEPVALTRYSDGLNTISVFQGRHVKEPNGPCKIYNLASGYQAHLVRNDTDYVLIGDIDSAQLKRMALSLKVPFGSSSGPARGQFSYH